MQERNASGSVSAPIGEPAVSGRVPRKVMFFGKNMSRTRCTGGLVDALRRHGMEVKWVNMATLRRWLGPDRADRHAVRQFQSFAPDVLFVFCRDLPLSLLSQFRNDAQVVLWIEDLLDESDETWPEYLSLADLVCMTAPQPRTRLRQGAQGNIAFTLSGFSPRFHYPVEPARRGPDVAFIGGPGRHGQRAKLLDEISQHFETEIYGVRRRWERWVRHYPRLRVRGSVRNAGYRRVCSSARIVLGLNEVNDLPLYFSNRTFLTLGCGGFLLTHHVPGIEQVFEDGVNLAWVPGRRRLPREDRPLPGALFATPAGRARGARAGAARAPVLPPDRSDPRHPHRQLGGAVADRRDARLHAGRGFVQRVGGFRRPLKRAADGGR